MIRPSMLPASLVLSAALAGIVSAQTIQINRENKTIAISTTDEATATADIAAVTIGFGVFGSDAESTYADGGKLSHAILEALHKTGIKDGSIESSDQGLQRNTDFNDKDTPEQRAQKRFVFRQSWVVSVAPKDAAQVIRVAVAAGANQSGAIEWRLSDRNALQAKAAQAALVKARAVASQMADGLHVKLGELIYASNETPTASEYKAVPPPAPPPPPAVMSPTLEIRPQTIREEATVYAVFAIGQ
ncbi:MAG TPA: SIMPL domain-containing protein [Terracidiphilus sp.]|nr:SIMPL domain-containing protein [Terracidiphilus sp.]